jgi:hypothetical protein
MVITCSVVKDMQTMIITEMPHAHEEAVMKERSFHPNARTGLSHGTKREGACKGKHQLNNMEIIFDQENQISRN